MAIQSVASLIEILCRFPFLEEEQVNALRTTLGVLYSDPRALAREMVRRGWLTPYQINQIFQDRAAELVIGAYILTDRLGEGAMGYVYKGRHGKLGRVVALKVIRKDRLQNAEAVARFHRETQATAQLSHPNVVLAFDADHVGDCHFIAMEYIDGTDLAQVVKERGPLPIDLACEAVRQGALGLQHAFERGLVHRDIKPSNLLLAREPAKDGGPVVKLLDLGLARLRIADQDEAAALTQEGQIVGTPDFIAPEQARHAHHADIRADIYSLGCTLFFLLTGKVPFPGGTLTEKLLRHHWDPPPAVETLRPDAPPRVTAVVARALAKNPDDRYQTPLQLAEALSTALLPVPEEIPDAALPVAPLISDRGAGGAAVALAVAEPATARAVSATALAEPTPASQVAPAATAERPRLVVPVRRRLTWWSVGAVVLVGLAGVGGLAAYFTTGFRGNPPPRQPPTSAPPLETERSPLDGLRAENIPSADRFPWNREHLVAVLGEHAGRHPGWAGCAAASPDGTTLASGGWDGVVRLWDAGNLRERGTLTGPMGGVWSLAFSPDGKTLACGDGSGTIRLWRGKPVGGQPIVVADAHREGVTVLAFTPDSRGLFSASRDGAVALWKLSADREPTRTAELTGHEASVSALSLSRDGQSLVTADEDGVVRLWDVSGEKPTRRARWQASEKTIRAAVFTHSGDAIVTGGDEWGLRWWSAETGKPLKGYGPLDTRGDARCLAFIGDSRVLVAGMGNGRVLLIDANVGPVIRERLDAGDGVAAVAVLPRQGDQTPIAALTGNGVLRLWDWRPGSVKARTEPRGHMGSVTGVAFSPDGKTLASSGWDRTIRLWDLSGPAPREQVHWAAGHDGVATSIAFSPDGARLAAVCQYDSWLRLFDMKGIDSGGRHMSESKKAHGTTLAFSPEGRYLAVGVQEDEERGDGRRGDVRLFDLNAAQPKETGRLTGHGEGVTGVVFYQGNSRVATAAGKDLRLWDREKAKLIRKLDQSATPITALAVAPSGDQLAAGEDGLIRFWDLKPQDARPLDTVAFEGGQTTALAYSPEGDLLALTSGGGRLIVLNARTRKTGPSWNFPWPVNAVAFAPDGRHLAVGNANGTIYIFRLRPPSIR